MSAGQARRPWTCRTRSRALKGVLEDPSIAKVGHDLKFDAIVLARHGVTLRGLETDTMLASYLLDATRSAHPLEDLALEHAGYKALREEDVCGRGAKADSARDAAGRDARSTTPASAPTSRCSSSGDAARICCGKEELETVYHELELPLIPVLVAIERAGIRIDGRRARRAGRSTSTRSWRRAARRSSSWPARSSTSTRRKQLSKILFDKLQLPGD